MANVDYEVTAPDGTVLVVTGPEGASQDVVRAQAKKLYAKQKQTKLPPPPVDPTAPTSDADLKAHQEARGRTLSSVLGQAAEFGGKYNPLAFIAGQGEKAFPNALQGLEQSAVDFETGIGGGVGNLVEGVRQAWNKKTGDEEELGLLNKDTELRRRKLAELTKANPGLANIGEVVGEAAPSLLIPGVGPGIGLAGRVGLGVATGGAQGYASALTPAEEAGGERANRAKWGAALGGAGGMLAPRATQFGQDLRESGQKMLPEDALQDFLGRTVGKTDNVADTFSNIKSGVSGKVSELDKEFKQMYPLVEDKAWKAFGSPNVPIKADTLLNHPNLTADTMQQLTAKDSIREVMTLMKNGNSEIPYPLMTQAVRDLNEIGNRAKIEGSGASEIAKSLAAEFRGALDETGQAVPEVGMLNKAMGTVTDKFKNEMVPLDKAGTGAPIGTWREGGMTEKDFADTFMSGQSGSQLQDLFARVPEVKGDVRKYFGTVQGAQPEIKRALGSSSTRDVLFEEPAERAYASKVSKALRGGADDEEMTALKKFGRRFTGQFNPLLNLAMPERLARGILPYGKEAKTFTNKEKTAQALRGAIILKAMQTQDEVSPLDEED